MGINPIKLRGSWDEGFALDVHVVSSTPKGEDVYGRMQFDTDRSEMGELLYQFKYRGKHSSLEKIIDLAVPFLKEWTALKTVTSVLPVPASNTLRPYQPAYEIAQEIAEIIGVAYAEDVLVKVSDMQSKGLTPDEKKKITGTIEKRLKAQRKHNLLLVDDLYQSGVTLEECVKILRQDKNVDKIYVLTMTKTKE